MIRGAWNNEFLTSMKRRGNARWKALWNNKSDNNAGTDRAKAGTPKDKKTIEKRTRQSSDGK